MKHERQKDYQLISRASALHIEQIDPNSGAKSSGGGCKLEDVWESDDTEEAMRNVKTPLNITYEEIHDMAKTLPLCQMFDIDLKPFTIKTGKVNVGYRRD